MSGQEEIDEKNTRQKCNMLRTFQSEDLGVNVNNQTNPIIRCL
jgi:hypothetical protein